MWEKSPEGDGTTSRRTPRELAGDPRRVVGGEVDDGAGDVGGVAQRVVGGERCAVSG